MKKSESMKSGILPGIRIKRMKVVFLFLAFSCALCFASVIEKTVMKAGVARVVISNETPRIMVNKVTSEGILHDIYARALVLNDGVTPPGYCNV